MPCNYKVCPPSISLAEAMPCINGIPITKGTLEAIPVPYVPDWDCSSSCVQALIKAYQFWGLNPPSPEEICSQTHKMDIVKLVKLSEPQQAKPQTVENEGQKKVSIPWFAIAGVGVLVLIIILIL